MKITKEDIKALFKEYNKLYFDGVLPSCKCHVFKGKGACGRYNYSKRSNGKYEGSIWIAYNIDWLLNNGISCNGCRIPVFRLILKSRLS